MEWITGLKLTAQGGIAAYKHRHYIQEYFVKAKALLNIGKTQIIVTGLPSAGKSMLVGQMHGRARELYHEAPGESKSVEVDAITLGEWTKLVRVLPGQVGYRVQGELEAFVANEALEGLIHVVDFGYSGPRDQILAGELIREDGLDTIEKLRGRNLERELEALKLELANVRKLLSGENNFKWIVIAVNKIDLFGDKLESALAHYHPSGSSSFSKELRDFQSAVGSNNVKIYVAKTCASEDDFVWANEIVKSSLGHNAQRENLRDFMKTISLILRDA
ncbi:GTPase domain-containing protein [Pseudomonas sp. PNP]|uniref:GTPase domain-containing protein n=1 Tax=Pseudomonas sp. PNP TaxID=361819 RepID=UPI001AECD601|nr:GTPase domain-containing protein [Pseudomonas sp. PNP]MBP2841200.1 GTPase domain-containing protein [Pseudomonas sp. PNP]